MVASLLNSELRHQKSDAFGDGAALTRMTLADF
jgi:hypothetical protein